MSCKHLAFIALVAAGFIAGCATMSTTNTTASSSATPCLDVLPLFTAPDVPAMGPLEAPQAMGRWTNAPTPPNLPGNGLAEHPLLYLGEGYNTLFLVNQGKIIWTYSTGKGNELDDAWMLSNGNILFTRMQYLAEITPEKKEIWRYTCPTNTEVHCCCPIGLDKVLFIQNGLPPHLMVVNLKTGAVEVNHVVPCRSLTDHKTIHPQYRRVRYTADGHYLVPCLGLGTNGVVLEYDKDFNVVWSYKIHSPWAAIRLKNGNTLITDENDHLTREVNPAGKTVWEFSITNLPPEYQIKVAPQTCTRLANGDTIFCSRERSGNGPQLAEVTPDKKVVWMLQDWKDLGPATAVQVLDDPGIPENPWESEH
jgi:hypothetical protein